VSLLVDSVGDAGVVEVASFQGVDQWEMSVEDETRQDHAGLEACGEDISHDPPSTGTQPPRLLSSLITQNLR